MTTNSLSPLPPHDVESERALLGSLLIDPDAFYAVKPILNPSDFYLRVHGWIFGAVERAAEAGDLDYVTLCADLQKRGVLDEVGGATYVAGLIGAVPSALHVESYAEIVRDAATRRAMIRAASDIAKLAHDEAQGMEDVLHGATCALRDVVRPRDRTISMETLASRVYDHVSYWTEPHPAGETRYLSTGLRPLDDATGGLKPGLYIIGARTSVGKTSLVLQIARNVALRGRRVLFVSPEMTELEIGLRLACADARVSEDRLERGQATSDELVRVMDALSTLTSYPLALHTAVSDVGSVRSLILREHLQEPLSLVVVDGLQLLSTSQRFNKRHLEIGSIARDLHLTALDKDVLLPVLVTHQLGRDIDRRGDKRPKLSDLREGGEEHADVVWMLYRAGYYDPEAPDANVMEIWIQKNRLGGPRRRRVKMYWKEAFACLEPLEREPEPVRFD